MKAVISLLFLPLFLLAETPLLDSGRIRPYSVVSREVTQHMETGKETPEEFLLTWHIEGFEKARKKPLFTLSRKLAKKWKTAQLISYNTLQEKLAQNPLGKEEKRLEKEAERFRQFTATAPLLPPKRGNRWSSPKKLGSTAQEILAQLKESKDFSLKAERILTLTPWIKVQLLLYALAAVSFFYGLVHFGWTSILAAFSIHTLALLLRVVILGRPPVSNMGETLLYVPWVATLLALFSKRSLYLGAASLTAFLLTLLLYLSGQSALSTLQPVLDSQLWLSTHVLMVVGSYGVFLFAAALGHLYLLKPSSEIEKPLLRSLQLGTGLLIVGTILGGIWAAQSWGRFWDWDPKESWAFISSCTYLILIHAYRYKKIALPGLAVGSILGFLAITFTWYGVNYILGVGLHSYGFGNGGEIYYYAYLIAECIFLQKRVAKCKKIGIM